MSDKMPNETAEQIDLAAAAWAARLDRAALSAAEEQELDAWLEADPRRIGAFAKAQAVALHFDRARALGDSFDPEDFVAPMAPVAERPASMSRRRLLWGGGAAAALTGGVTAGLSLAVRGERFATKRGEMRVVPLSDGSVVSLNTESNIHVLFSKTERAIHLDDGEALFDVAKDKLRPFVVYAGETVISAVGTSFTVRKLADTPVQVLVREGVVDVRQRLSAAQPVRLSANMRAISEPSPVMSQGAPAQPVHVATAMVEPADVERALAWREGRIAFEGETLAQAVVELQRYSDTRIVIDDPSVANEEITGLFQANNAVGFAQTVATSFGLHAEVSEKQVRLYR
jgi:transmembrane sensor